MRISLCLLLALIGLAVRPATAQDTTIPTPTLFYVETSTPVALLFATNTPSFPVTYAPTLTQTPLPSPTPTATLSPAPLNTHIPTFTPDPNGTPPATWTPPPPDPASQIADHYRFYRPIGPDNVNYLDRTYPYGGNSGGALQVHHGVDLVNPTGTNVLAAGAGTVVFAGDDLTQVIGLSTNYYGNAIIIQHNFNSPEGQPVFTLYGHLSKVNVAVGQAVDAGDVIGEVGAEGVAFGPHLHFEVRIGDWTSFDATRNPDLWIYPYRNFGTLAGRVTDAAGNILYSAPLQIRSEKSARYTYTYADNSVHGDDTFHENFTYGDLPEGYYEVSVNDGQRIRFRQTIYIYPNRTTWLNVQLN